MDRKVSDVNVYEILHVVCPYVKFQKILHFSYMAKEAGNRNQKWKLMCNDLVLSFEVWQIECRKDLVSNLLSALFIHLEYGNELLTAIFKNEFKLWYFYAKICPTFHFLSVQFQPWNLSYLNYLIIHYRYDFLSEKDFAEQESLILGNHSLS